MGNKNSKTDGYSTVDHCELTTESKQRLEVDEFEGEETKDLSNNENISKTTEKNIKDARDAFVEGNRLFRESRFDLAKAEYATALTILRDQSSETELHRAVALSNMAILEFVDGRYVQAKSLLEEALALRQGWSGACKHSPESLMEGMQSISISLSKDKMFCRTPLEQKILAKEIKEHGTIDAVIADTINNIGACLEVLGNIDEARGMYEESLSMRKIVYGNHSVKVAETMLNLATLLDSQGHLMEAEDLLLAVIAIYEDTRGKHSTESAVAMNNLGVLRTHLGRFDEAEKLLKDVVLIRGLAYGDDHPLTVCAQQNLQYIQNKRQSISSRLT